MTKQLHEMQLSVSKLVKGQDKTAYREIAWQKWSSDRGVQENIISICFYPGTKPGQCPSICAPIIASICMKGIMRMLG